MPWQRTVTAALARLEPDIRRLAEDLVAVPSVGGTAGEAAVQGVLADWLAAHDLAVQTTEVAITPSAPGFPGMEVERDRLVHVVGRLAGSGAGPDLLLLGHTDVVPATRPGAFEPRWDSGRLIGRGTADMKSGVAAMAAAAAAWAASGHQLLGDLIVAAVGAEEDGGAGTFHLLRDSALQGLHPGSAAVIPEPTGGRLVSANAGCLTFRIRLPGRSAHGALRWRGYNPLDSVPAVLAALRGLEAQRCRDPDPLFAEVPLAYPISVGTIAGGDWASTVPSEIVLTGRYGVQLGESLAEARAVFEAAVAQACARDRHLAAYPAEVGWWGAEFASARTADDAPIVAALGAAAASPRLFAAPYGSDLRLTVGLAGLPTVQFGPGRPEDAHTDEELVDWSAVVDCARVLALTAGGFCGVAGSAVDNSAP